MKKFEFSFQYLLDAHKAREQAAEHALHTAIKEEALAKQELARVEQERTRQVEVIAGMNGVVNRTQYAIYLRGIDAAQRTIAECHVRVKRCSAEICKQRQALHEEMKRRKVLEHLREREREEWQLEAQSEAQKQMDELAVGRWARQARTV